MNTNISSAASPVSAKYWSELKDLSTSVKLELITLLRTSISCPDAEKPEDKGWTASFAGKWQDDRTSEEIINDIRSARSSIVRDIEL